MFPLPAWYRRWTHRMQRNWVNTGLLWIDFRRVYWRSGRCNCIDTPLEIIQLPPSIFLMVSSLFPCHLVSQKIVFKRNRANDEKRRGKKNLINRENIGQTAETWLQLANTFVMFPTWRRQRNQIKRINLYVTSLPNSKITLCLAGINNLSGLLHSIQNG